MRAAALASTITSALVALVIVVPVAQAASWQTVVIASDRETSEYGSGLDLNLGTTLERVSAWRLVTKTSAPLKTSVRVSCERGEARASKSITFSATTSTKTIPLPLAGGNCDVSIWAYNVFSTGSATMRVQAR